MSDVSSGGLALYSDIENALKALAIKTLASDTRAKYLAITGVFIQRYDKAAEIHYFIGDGVNRVTRAKETISLETLQKYGWDAYKVIRYYERYFAMKDGFNGCFTKGGSPCKLKDIIVDGGFAIGFDGWSLKNLMETPLDHEMKDVLGSTAKRLKLLLTTSTVSGDHTLSFEAVPSRQLQKLYVPENWEQDAPATFRKGRMMDGEGHVTVMVRSNELQQVLGAIEVTYPKATEMSTDSNKPYLSQELHAYGKVLEGLLSKASNGQTFTNHSGGTFKFASESQVEVPSLNANVLITLTRSQNPTTLKRQERFKLMAEHLRGQGINPKTSIGGQPIYEIPLPNDQVLVAGATFGILYKSGKQVGVLYNLEQVSIEQVIASVTMTNNELLIWLVTSMDLRRSVQPFKPTIQGGRA